MNENPFAALEAAVCTSVDAIVASCDQDIGPLPWSLENVAYLAIFNEMVSTLVRMNAHIAASIPKLRKAHMRAVKSLAPAPGGKA